MENIILTLCVIVAIFLYSLYVSLIKKKNNLYESSSGIDVQLKKRYDLIPNLLTMAAKYMEHERDLMESITKLRNDAMDCDFAKTPHEKINLDNMLSEKMGQFKLTAENYPDMKSDTMMNTAMLSLNEVEENIAASRRFYNSSVKAIKNAVEIWPSSMIARWIGIKDEMPFFEASEVEKKEINAESFFK